MILTNPSAAKATESQLMNQCKRNSMIHGVNMFSMCARGRSRTFLIYKAGQVNEIVASHSRRWTGSVDAAQPRNSRKRVWPGLHDADLRLRDVAGSAIRRIHEGQNRDRAADVWPQDPRDRLSFSQRWFVYRSRAERIDRSVEGNSTGGRR